MLESASNSNLLYVSDIGAETVDVFTYPKGKLVGTLTGFTEPNGECVDKTGNVFITNTYASTILEYAHGSAKLKATLNDASYRPVGCAVDPTTGDLAVTNFVFDTGGLAIYKHAKGKPSLHPGGVLDQVYYCSCDDRGDLFVDGFPDTEPYLSLEEYDPRFFLHSVALSVEGGWPGGVQWDGKYLAVGDQYANKFEKSQTDRNVIYKVRVSGSTGTVVETAGLNDAGDISQFWIRGKNVIGPDAENEVVGYWNYPTGGDATKVLLFDFYEPVGATVSLAVPHGSVRRKSK